MMPADLDREELAYGISDYLDGVLADEEMEVLDEQLRTDPAAADLFCALAVQHALLRQSAGAAAEAAGVRERMGLRGRLALRVWAWRERLRARVESLQALVALVGLPCAPRRAPAGLRCGASPALAAVLQRRWVEGSWYVGSLGIRVVLLLLLLLLPVAPRPLRPAPPQIACDLDEREELVLLPALEPVEREVELDSDSTFLVLAPIAMTNDMEIAAPVAAVDIEEDADTEIPAAGGPGLQDLFTELTGLPALNGLTPSEGRGQGGGFGIRCGAGRRMLLLAGGGSRATENAVRQGLLWLAHHQEADGSWDCAKYGGQAQHNVAATSLALLAFLGSGSSIRSGPYHSLVRRGVLWLQRQQAPNGCVGPHRYQAALALMVLAEAYGMGAGEDLRRSAQRAVQWAAASQCPSGGWDYTARGGAEQRSDSSVTGWWVMALKSAKTAGLEVPEPVLQRALEYCRRAITQPTVPVRADARCTMSYSNPGPRERIQAGGGSPRLTAVGLTCLQFLGCPRTHPQVVGCVNQVLADGVPRAERPDFYRWYYAALGLFQLGAHSESWRQWNEPMKLALLQTQVLDGASRQERGSWNPETDAHGKQWGRVGQTALGTLMLEVYYRYQNMHEMRPALAKRPRWICEAKNHCKNPGESLE